MLEHLFLVFINELNSLIPQEVQGYLFVVYFTIYFMKRIDKNRKKK